MKLTRINAALLGSLALLMAACNDDHSDVAPGLYTELEQIATFPGDSVWVEGQVSNYNGMSTITLSCPTWDVEKVIELKGSPKVFNYSWQMIVPSEATFPEQLEVKVASVCGVTTTKQIPITFLEDVTNPWLTTDFPSQVSVDFDPEAAQGIWNVSVGVADDRNLKSATISVAGISYQEQIPLSGRSAKITKQIAIPQVGSYDATLSISDASGNLFDMQLELVVMIAEDEDPIADYDQLYVVNADENPDDYVHGYYRFMDRQGECQYSSRFYAPKDNTHIYFVPTKSMDGDLYGTSPYVNSKLMNKPGYVVPVVIEKAGYYWLWADLANHSYNVTQYDPATDGAIFCNEDVWVSGTGFDFGDWGAYAEPMTLNGYRYSQDSNVYAGTGNQYYFYTAGWARVFRADAEGCWWFESASGACCTFNTDYSGACTFLFDTAAAWAQIKKAK